MFFNKKESRYTYSWSRWTVLTQGQYKPYLLPTFKLSVCFAKESCEIKYFFLVFKPYPDYDETTVFLRSWVARFLKNVNTPSQKGPKNLSIFIYFKKVYSVKW